MSVPDEKILGQADALLKREKVSVFLDLMMEILFFMVYSSAMVFVLDRVVAGILTDRPYWLVSNNSVIVIELFLISISLAAAISVTAGRFRNPLMRIRTAKNADDALKLQDRFASAVDFASRGKGNPVEELAKDDATGIINRIDTTKIIRLPKIGYRWGILLGYMTIAMIIFVTPENETGKDTARPAGRTPGMTNPQEEAAKILKIPAVILEPGADGIMGEPERAENIKKIPKYVEPLIGEGPTQIKEINVYNDEQDTNSVQPQVPLKQIITKYRKIAENTIAQEKYPLEDKQLLLKYFDRLK